MAAKTYPSTKTSKPRSSYTRFDLFQRIEHFVLILSFTTLSVTGIPQKYALNAVSQFVISLLGGIESTRVIHRVAATIFLLQSIYHIVMAVYKVYVKGRPADMVPGIKDGKDAIQWLKVRWGLAKEHPKMPRYNFMEKMEYWAMAWGLVLMGITGLMLWNPIATTNILPGQFIPAAKAAHGAEAVLAVLAIILWHFYNVHIKQFNKSMFTGKITRHEMVEEHGAELEAIESGKVVAAPAPLKMRQRLGIFLPVAGVLSVALVALTIFFITFEQTAIATIPPVSDVPVFVRPTATMPAVAAETEPAAPSGGESGGLTWHGAISAMMADNCTGCHGTMGGFGADTYENMMQAVVPGDPDASPVVAVQVEGGHPAQLSEEDLNQLIEWVAAGAPEGEPGAGGEAEAPEAEATEEPEVVVTEIPPATGPISDMSWDGMIGPMFQAKCASCHGNLGGFNAETYTGVMQAIVPGDAENSQVIITQYARHPEMFTNDEFDLIREWINQGAPQR